MSHRRFGRTKEKNHRVLLRGEKERIAEKKKKIQRGREIVIWEEKEEERRK